MVATADGRLLVFGGTDFSVARGFYEFDTSAAMLHDGLSPHHLPLRRTSTFVAAAMLLVLGIVRSDAIAILAAVAILVVAECRRIAHRILLLLRSRLLSAQFSQKKMAVQRLARRR